MQEHDQETVPPRKRSRRGLLARTALSLFIPYVAVVTMIAFVQRKLIYLPNRESVSAAETGYGDSQLHDIQLTTHDGLELGGWLVLADDANSTGNDLTGAVQGTHPLIVYFPGNGGHRAYRIKEIQQFTDLGCHVLYFDYRGYADNPGRPSESDFTADARAVWTYATEQLDVPPDRILLWGESLGGGVATRLASDICDEGARPGGLMLRGTFSSLVNAAAYHYPWLPVRWLLVDRYPSIDCIGSVTCPILHLHGDVDRVVPIEQGRALFAAAPDESHTGIEKTFVELSDTGHNDVMYIAADQVESAVSDFLQTIDQSTRP